MHLSLIHIYVVRVRNPHILTLAVEYDNTPILFLYTIEHAVILSQESDVYSREVGFWVEISKVFIGRCAGIDCHLETAHILHTFNPLLKELAAWSLGHSGCGEKVAPTEKESQEEHCGGSDGAPEMVLLADWSADGWLGRCLLWL